MARHSFAYLFERFPSFVQTFVYREAAEMVRQKMEPCLVSIRAPDDAAEVAEALDLDVTYLPPNAELRAEIDRLREARQLPAFIRHAITRARQEPDSNRLFEAVWLGAYLRRHGIKHVHAHFAGVAARTAWRLRALYGISYSFTGHANDIFCETNYPVSHADLIRDAKFIVTETDFARGWLETKYPRAHGKTFRVYNGIDSNFPPRQPAGEAPRIVSVGRLIEKKGFDDLIEACLQMRARSHPFECMIIGDGPLQSALQAQIDRASFGKSVQLLGARSQTEVRQLLASARLFVLPSVPESDGGSDNLPTVIMEAMMCCLPVISTRLAGIPEMIQHGENGLLVSPRNPASLALAIEQLLRDVTFADRLGTRARGTAIHKFSIEATTRTLKHLLVQRARVRVPSGARQFDPALRAPWWRRWLGAC